MPLKCTLKNYGKRNILGLLKNDNLYRIKIVSPEQSTWCFSNLDEAFIKFGVWQGMFLRAPVVPGLSCAISDKPYLSLSLPSSQTWVWTVTQYDPDILPTNLIGGGNHSVCF